MIRVIGFIQALGLIVVISAARLGKYPTFSSNEQRNRFTSSIKDSNPKRKRKPLQGVYDRR